MRTGLMLLLSLFILSGCERLSSKPASLEEITKVIDALRVAGCTGLKELDVVLGSFGTLPPGCHVY